MQFVAVSLTGAGETDAATLPPLTIRYSGDEMRFPATMARTSMVETLRTTLYVFGPQRASVSGWSSQTRPDIAGDINASPVGLLESAMWEVGGEQPGYLEVWSGGHTTDYPEPQVTRFDTFASADAHTVDSVFALDGDGEVHTIITLTEGDTTEAWLFVPLLLIGGAGLRRRR